jgi:hypothetical protein|tara:strand:+ start:894 stop:1031 length:138 start_codon:yes stop_codon:yes gene_type:complete
VFQTHSTSGSTSPEKVPGYVKEVQLHFALISEIMAAERARELKVK